MREHATRDGPRRSRTAAVALLALGVAALPRPAYADVYQEFVGVRSEAMGGAHRGLGTSNDAIQLNPAGMALNRRYSIDVTYGYSGQDSLSHIAVSALDSKTGPVSGSIAYSYSVGDHDGSDVSLHRFYLSTAYALTEYLAFGLTAEHLRGDFRDPPDGRGAKDDIEIYTGDLGLSLVLGGVFGFGFTYHNVFTTSRKRMVPPHLGFGLAYYGEELAIATDLEVDLRERRLGDLSFRVGAEYLLFGSLALRGGYRAEPYIRESDGQTDTDHVISAGLAWVTQSWAIELAYTHSVIVTDDWDIIPALKFFM